MDRKDFIKKGILGTGAIAIAGTAVNAAAENHDQKDIVGFNHIPSAPVEAADNFVIHRANTRGGANHGWLQTKHSFSFSNYYDPERMGFGKLRVLNDDIIAGGTGFGTHPHDNMEIISIPLEGALKHKDSMGNEQVIKAGDIQVMSAGTGITHSEMNGLKDKPGKFLQIWVYPNKRGVTPRYDQITLKEEKNKLQQILSPSPDDAGVWIYQDAWFDLGTFDKGQKIQHKLRRPKTHGVYAFVINGNVTINGQKLGERDAMGIWKVSSLDINTESNARLLLMEVEI